MKRGWSVWAWNDGGVSIRFQDGETVEVRTDGRSGYGFAEEYIGEMSLHYQGQLQAADGILQRMLGSKYATIRTFRRIYLAYLAVTSMRCAFGQSQGIPHYDGKGNFHFGHSPCPIRPVCPFNGYSNGHHRSVCGCNPIYETGLSERQTEIADLLANSPLSLTEIADHVYLDEGRVRNLASEVYAKLGVKNRQELVCFLRGKRVR